MVNLGYGADVPQPLLEVVEHHARTLGLPLHLLELMGQSVERAEEFILAAEKGLGLAYAMSVAYGSPFDLLLGGERAPRDPRDPVQRALSGHVKQGEDAAP